MTRPDQADWRAEHAALTAAAGLVDLGDRTQIELTGRDAATFLHNLCTNDIKRFAPGSGCEAFLCNVQGKTIGHILVFRGTDSLIVDTVPGQAETLLKHLDRYLIREQVELRDRSSDRAESLLAGANADKLLAGLGISVPGERHSHVAAEIGGRAVEVRRVDMTRPGGFLVSYDRNSEADVRNALLSAGAASCGRQAYDAARIEAGWPNFGQDMTDDNLPQELDRDKLAISFTKGCYLGQETVARIDALGHVNRTLCGVRFAGDVPPTGTELKAADKAIGRVTSAEFSPHLNAPLALAYLRRGHNQPRAVVDSPSGPAEVITLPVA